MPYSRPEIEEAGVPHLGSSSEKGDFLVIIKIDIPTRISDSECEHLEGFAKSQGVEFAPETVSSRNIKI